MTIPSTDAIELRRKRARIRAWRRGMKEMDLLLGGFFDQFGATMEEAELVVFERLLERNDQELYTWLSTEGSSAPCDASPPESAMVEKICQNHTKSDNIC